MTGSSLRDFYPLPNHADGKCGVKVQRYSVTTSGGSEGSDMAGDTVDVLDDQRPRPFSPHEPRRSLIVGLCPAESWNHRITSITWFWDGFDAHRHPVRPMRR